MESILHTHVSAIHDNTISDFISFKLEDQTFGVFNAMTFSLKKSKGIQTSIVIRGPIKYIYKNMKFTISDLIIIYRY